MWSVPPCVNHGSKPRLQTPRVNLGVFLFATGFATRGETRVKTPFKPRLQKGFKRLLRTKGAAFCNGVATVVRNLIVNKVADEGFKQGGKKVGMDCCTCWNNGRKGTAEPSVAKMSLLIFMTEANKQTLKP